MKKFQKKILKKLFKKFLKNSVKKAAAEAANEAASGKPKTENQNNPYVKIIADRTGLPYDEVQQKMRDARETYGISFRDYVALKCEKCETEEDFLARLKIKERRKEAVMTKLTAATGWPKEKAEAEIKRVYDKFGISARKYYSEAMYLLDDEGIAEALKKQQQRKEEVLSRCVEESGWSEKNIKKHMKYASSKYGIDNTDYMLIKAWRFSDEEMDRLSCLATSKALTTKYNNHNARILSNKLEFDEVFEDCIQRKFWTNDEEADFASFCHFWEGLDEAMLKPLSLFQARGIRKIPRPENLEEAFNEFKASPQLLLEEVVKQHSLVSEVYPDCVNTVRMVTLLKDDEYHVLCAFMKFGKDGSVVDNMIAGGMIAGVDEANGVIETAAVDRDRHVYEFHPNTGKPIKGFKIPNYDKILEVTEKALRKVDGINFVGWDVAVCEDKAVIIEGNSLPGLMAYQLPYVQEPLMEPKKAKFEPYL